MARLATQPGNLARGTTLAVIQPGYLPWLGFFDQFDRADVFVLYDDVDFDKNGWRNRNRIKTSQGIGWLTVPVLTSGRSGQLVLDVVIDKTRPWQRKHIRSIQESYSKAPFFELYFTSLEALLSRPWERLVDLDIELIRLMSSWLGLDGKPVVLSSTLGIPRGRNERLLAICERFGADTYLSGNLAKSYLDVDAFTSSRHTGGMAGLFSPDLRAVARAVCVKPVLPGSCS